MKANGFTLAELLIALAILGVIATFTIPKVLQNQQDSRYKAIAKEAAGTISAAYQAYQLQNTVTTATSATNLLPYMNYVSYDTTSQLDDVTSLGAMSCSNATPCVRLHNGAALLAWNATFNGTATTNALWFQLDPDGVYGGSTTGNSKSVVFFLYYDGSIKDWGSARSPTINNSGTYGPNPPTVPSWFAWN
jgi:prepilin-type N-terminal cleavage/methylation domain-containing protein